MRRYETIFVSDPDLSDEDRLLVFDRLKEIIPQYKGKLLEFDEWGIKKLAYEVKKKQRGFYVRMDYCGMGDLVSELERIMRLNDRVMKYLTVLLDKNVDLEAIEQEMAEAEDEDADYSKSNSDKDEVIEEDEKEITAPESKTSESEDSTEDESTKTSEEE
ncbi:Small ribosomal subunit protein bS6 [Candidatus Magnetomoraceae bacterium gMMP-15]